MVDSIGIKNQFINVNNGVSFGKKATEEQIEHEHDRLLVKETAQHPISTSAKIQADKLIKGFTEYPKKGMQGSKNANFYQFLTMGLVPYLTGSAAMIGVFNLASKFFDTPSAVNATKNVGKKMGIGVVLYGIGKVLSKKLIEKPLKWRYGIDVNLPYKKKIDELPEEGNRDNLVSYEYHKAYESVDFPRWDLFYNNKDYGENRNAYYDKIAKKMGMKDAEHSDQKVKDKIKEKVIQTKVFSTLSSYLWAATGVAIAAQKPWENLVINPKTRLTNFVNHIKVVRAAETAAETKAKQVVNYNFFVKDFGSKFVTSCKELVNKGSKANKYMGRILVGAAIGMTLLGNFKTLFDFNKNRGHKAQGASSIIDESKEKVVC